MSPTILWLGWERVDGLWKPTFEGEPFLWSVNAHPVFVSMLSVLLQLGSILSYLFWIVLNVHIPLLLFVGGVIYQINGLAANELWDLWFYSFTGSKSHHSTTRIDIEILNESRYYLCFFQAFPFLIIQTAELYLHDEWTHTMTVLSILSCLIIIEQVLKFVKYRLWFGYKLDEIPVEVSIFGFFKVDLEQEFVEREIEIVCCSLTPENKQIIAERAAFDEKVNDICHKYLLKEQNFTEGIIDFAVLRLDKGISFGDSNLDMRSLIRKSMCKQGFHTILWEDAWIDIKEIESSLEPNLMQFGQEEVKGPYMLTLAMTNRFFANRMLFRLKSISKKAHDSLHLALSQMRTWNMQWSVLGNDLIVVNSPFAVMPRFKRTITESELELEMVEFKLPHKRMEIVTNPIVPPENSINESLMDDSRLSVLRKVAFISTTVNNLTVIPFHDEL